MVSSRPLRVLFIGNSFTIGSGDPDVVAAGGVPGLFADVAEAAGLPRPETLLRAAGGRKFSDHLTDETGAMTAIRAGGIDFAVLQGYSTMPTRIGDTDAFVANGKRLHDAIRGANPGALTVLFETWAREATHPMVAGPDASFAGGPAEMQADLRLGYARLARELGSGVRIAPVGDAWERGLAARPATVLHAADRYHASRLGSFLAAFVIARTVFADVPLPLDHPLATDRDAIAFLAETARACVP